MSRATIGPSSEAQPSGMPELARRLGSVSATRPARDRVSPLALSRTEIERLWSAPSPVVAFRHAAFRDRVAAISGAFKAPTPARLRVAYSVKTNPDPEVMRIAFEAGLIPEVISLEEARAARRAGYTGGAMVVNGPAKRFDDPAWPACGIAFADSIEECESWTDRPSALKAAVFGVRFRVARHDSRFGVDVRSGDSRARLIRCLARHDEAVPLAFSFHVSPSLSGVRGWRDCMLGLLELVESFPRPIRDRVTALDLGGGWDPDDIHLLQDRFLPELQDRLAGSLQQVKDVIVELGRALLQDLGVYACKVLEVRPSSRAVVVDGSVMDLPDLRSEPKPLAWISTSREIAKVAHGSFTVLGRTCMEADVLFRDLAAPLDAARLVIGHCGAYEFSMGPMFGLAFKSRDLLPIEA